MTVPSEPGGPFACCRSSLGADAGLGRQRWRRPPPESGEERAGRGGVDTCCQGGLALEDAPEPWIAWTPAGLCHRWDAGPREMGCFPTKWVSADGRTVYLVFSGDGTFAVRRATLCPTGGVPTAAIAPRGGEPA